MCKFYYRLCALNSAAFGYEACINTKPAVARLAGDTPEIFAGNCLILICKIYHFKIILNE